MTKRTPQIGDSDYDPSKDELFLDKVQPAEPAKVQPPESDPAPPRAEPLSNEPNMNYHGTGKSADELVAEFGTNPDGTPRTEAAPTGPACPPVSPQDGPFNTTAIPPGCGEPLTAECAAYLNETHGFAAPPETRSFRTKSA